jgi:TPR repeat protein
LREAAEAEEPLAQFTYGTILKEGRDVPRDVELGRSYVKRALRNGYSIKGKALKKLFPDTPIRPPEIGTPETGSPEIGTPEAGSPEAGSPKARSPETGSAKTPKGSKRKKR